MCLWFTFVVSMESDKEKVLTVTVVILTLLQSHVSGAIHDVSDGPAARGLLAAPHFIQELPAGWRGRRHHVCHQWDQQSRVHHQE